MEDAKNQTSIDIKTPDGKVLTIVSKPGKDGYTPIKGKDYFDGDKGDPGKDYILTDKDKKDIASKIEVPVVEKIIEKVETIIEKPITIDKTKTVIKEISKYEDADTIATKLNTLSKVIDFKVIKNFPDLLNNGGSGLNTVFTDGTTITGNGLADNPLRVIETGGNAEWGEITGTLSNQTDLQTVLDTKATKNFAIAMALALG